MSDAIHVPYPSRFVDPNEPFLLAGYNFGEGQLAQFSRYLNLASSGALYDLTTRTGTPLIGFAGGLYVNYRAGSYWQGAAVPLGASPGYDVMQRIDVLPAAELTTVYNSPHRPTIAYADGTIGTSLDNAVTVSRTLFSVVGRGPFVASTEFVAGRQRLLINGRLADDDAVVPGAIVGPCLIGFHGEFLQYMLRQARSDAETRAWYVKNFARRIVYHWQPASVGEGPAGGIPTGAVGEGDWFAPLGGATLQHVWRNDLSAPGGGRLVLTDTGATLRRLAYTHPKAPVFGSWVLRYEVRDPATDSLQFALSPLRDNDYTAAGSNAYWVHLRQVAGPWWRASLYRANGAQLDAVDTPSLPVVGDRGVLLLTHHVDGTWQIYNYLRSLRSWFWSVASPVEVTSLSTSYIHIAPRGAYVEGLTRYQGEADPQELEVAVP